MQSKDPNNNSNINKVPNLTHICLKCGNSLYLSEMLFDTVVGFVLCIMWM